MWVEVPKESGKTRRGSVLSIRDILEVTYLGTKLSSLGPKIKRQNNYRRVGAISLKEGKLIPLSETNVSTNLQGKDKLDNIPLLFKVKVTFHDDVCYPGSTPSILK